MQAAPRCSEHDHHRVDLLREVGEYVGWTTVRGVIGPVGAKAIQQCARMDGMRFDAAAKLLFPIPRVRVDWQVVEVGDVHYVKMGFEASRKVDGEA